MGKPQKTSASSDDLILHTAARSGDLNLVQSICSSNPLAVNSRDKHSRTPLHLAAWSGHEQVVSYLCKHRADVGASAMDDMGAIHFASQKGHLGVVRIVLSSGVSVKSCNRKGMTALHYAVQGSYLELVKYLVKKGASLSAKTKAGKTPFDLASNEEIQSFLVESEKSSSNVDLNGKGEAEEAHSEPPLEERIEASEGEAAGNEEKEEEDKVVKRRGEEDDIKESLGPLEERIEVSEGEAVGNEEKEEEDKVVKRRGEEDDIKENLPETKKAKVSLNHLLASDDTQEEEEDL